MVLVVVVEPSGDLVKRGRSVRHGADAETVALQPLHEGLAQGTLHGGDYTMDHTAGLFMFRADGGFARIIDYHEAPGLAVAKLRSSGAVSSTMPERPRRVRPTRPTSRPSRSTNSATCLSPRPAANCSSPTRRVLPFGPALPSRPRLFAACPATAADLPKTAARGCLGNPRRGCSSHRRRPACDEDRSRRGHCDRHRALPPRECANCLTNSGFEPDWSQNPLPGRAGRFSCLVRFWLRRWGELAQDERERVLVVRQDIEVEHGFEVIEVVRHGRDGAGAVA